jgi:hypothetical protein
MWPFNWTLLRCRVWSWSREKHLQKLFNVYWRWCKTSRKSYFTNLRRYFESITEAVSISDLWTATNYLKLSLSKHHTFFLWPINTRGECVRQINMRPLRVVLRLILLSLHVLICVSCFHFTCVHVRHLPSLSKRCDPSPHGHEELYINQCIWSYPSTKKKLGILCKKKNWKFCTPREIDHVNSSEHKKKENSKYRGKTTVFITLNSGHKTKLKNYKSWNKKVTKKSLNTRGN